MPYSKLQVDMPALVGQYLKLDKAGSVYKTLCPFHRDKNTKSLTIYQTDAYCFGCGRYWGPKRFLMDYLHISGTEALIILGEAPVVLPSFKPQGKSTKYVPMENIRMWHNMLKFRREYFQSRLFSDATIDREMWGWNGRRYVIPVWEGTPGKRCISVRLRAVNGDMPKYIGLKGYNDASLFNMWHVEQFYKDWPEGLKVVYLFFGEFDSMLATQDGFPSVSPTNGQNAWLPEWDEVFEEYNIVLIPDRGEELRGFQVASRFPGRSCVVNWPEGEWDDYNSWRLAGRTPDEFLCDVVAQSVEPDYSIERFWEDSDDKVS